jgi:hypothetical protein
MINVSAKQCTCGRAIPSFGLEGGHSTHCAACRTPTMVNLTNDKCSTGCGTIVTNRYDGYCLRCFVNLFPDQTVSRNYKVKELHFMESIKTSGIFDDLEAERVTFDKILSGGCSLRRPDISIEMYTHTIIIENDENQHQDYSCEHKRMMQLFQDTGNRPLVLLRFNPDGYKNADGEKVPSCFKWHKKLGVPMIKDQDAWQARIYDFVKLVKYHMKHVPDKEVTEEYMFYDGYTIPSI